MKMATAEREIERIATSKTESQFTIKATGKAFKILSSGLYKEKILAIVRELSCNAYDAHVASGQKDRPFDVHLPNALEPYFSVRDYGPSLSPSQIGPVYTTYFESTKNDNNEEIGGLGLGSKSPFSYVDSFTVISRHMGMRRTYTCFFDETDTPSLLLMSEEECNEPSGLEVKLPVRSVNFHEFRVKAERVYRYFDTQPNVVGNGDYSVETPPVLISGPGYKIHDDRSTRAIARMGIVAYPIDIHAVSGLTTEMNSLLAGTGIDIDFTIGKLDITAGREELSYDPHTQAAITERCTEVMEDLARRVLKQFGQCKTEFEARRLYGRLMTYNAVLQSFPQGAVPYRGKIINTPYFKVALNGTSLTLLRFNERMTYGRGLARYDIYSSNNQRAEDFQNIVCDDNTHVFLDDLKGQFMSGRVRKFREDNRNARVIVIRYDDVADYETLKKALDGIEIKLLSSLVKPAPSPRRPTSVLALNASYARGTYTTFVQRDAWEVVDDLPEPGDNAVFVSTVSSQIVDESGVKVDNFGGLYKTLVALKLWEPTDTIYSIPKTLMKNYVDQPTWRNLFDVLREKFEAKMVAENWSEHATLTQQYQEFREAHTSFGTTEYDLMKKVAANLPKDHPVTEFTRLLGIAQTSDFQKQVAVSKALNVPIPTTPVENIAQSLTSINETYPMVVYMTESYRWNRNTDKMGREAAQYISMIDENKLRSLAA